VVTQNVTLDGSIEMLGDWFDPQEQGNQSDLLEELHLQDSEADGFSSADRRSSTYAATGRSRRMTSPTWRPISTAEVRRQLDLDQLGVGNRRPSCLVTRSMRSPP
jgi:hypothetical protein